MDVRTLLQPSLSFDEAVQREPVESFDASVDAALASALLPPRALLGYLPLAELTNAVLALLNFIR
jgi:hypothetical protein